MTVVQLESTDDDRLTPYRNLKTPQSSESFVVEGRLLVERLFSSHFEVESVLTMENQLSIVRQIASEDVPIFLLTKAALCELVGFPFHRGILACARRQPSAPISGLIDSQDLPTRHRTIVVCPGTHDDANLGSILRTASAFGVDGLLLGPKGPDPFSRKVLRISMGAALQIPIRTSHQLAADVLAIRSMNFRTVGLVLDDNATPLKSFDAPKRMAILLGSEDSGLTGFERTWCDDEVTIPMRPGTDSLNVAIAFAIAVHQLRG